MEGIGLSAVGLLLEGEGMLHHRDRPGSACSCHSQPFVSSSAPCPRPSAWFRVTKRTTRYAVWHLTPLVPFVLFVEACGVSFKWICKSVSHSSNHPPHEWLRLVCFVLVHSTYSIQFTTLHRSSHLVRAFGVLLSCIPLCPGPLLPRAVTDACADLLVLRAPCALCVTVSILRRRSKADERD